MMLKALSESWDGGGGGARGRGAGGKQCQSRDPSLHIPPQSFVFTPLLKQFHTELSHFLLILVHFFSCISRIMMRSCKLMSMDTIR